MQHGHPNLDGLQTCDEHVGGITAVYRGPANGPGLSSV
jgi:hypothetical protein